jgi:uncharacterized protein
MEWLNEPASWQRMGDVLTVSVDPGTDFWRETGYGYVRDSGHVYGELLAGDLDVSVRLRCTLSVQYDQAGVMLRADERTWLKTGVEFFEGRARLSTVLTLGRSSWMVTDLPEGTDDIVLRVSRRGDAVEVRYEIEDGPAELAALVFLPPGREVLAGVMAAAPEGPGFRVTFHDLRITERNWTATGGDPGWQDEQAGWAAGQAPEWQPADGEPDWPALADESAASTWPVPVAGDADPEWHAPAGEAGTGWTGDAAAEDPDWPFAGPADEEAGWAAPAAAEADGPEPAAVAEPVDEPAEPEPVEPEPAFAGLADPEPAQADVAEAAHGSPEPAGEEPAEQEASGLGAWSPAPVPGHDWSPVTGGDSPAAVDPAADWEWLAAGAQAAAAGGPPAAPWRAQADADVANEWPGPPLRTAQPNGLLAGDATPGLAGDLADDAQTDPGLLPRPRVADPAETGPGRAEPGTGGPGASATEPAAPYASAPDPGEPAPSARETRRSRSKRAAAEQRTQPDAADEWISLLTADQVDD